MLNRICGAIVVGIVVLDGASRAAAQEIDASTAIFGSLERYLPAISAGPAAQGVLLLPSGEAHVLPRPRLELRRPDRFESLCLTLAGLTVLDTITTSRALNDGSGRELNPLLAPFASNAPALVATKAVVDVAAVYLARRIWRRDHRAAVKVLIASNAIVGIAVAKNASVAGPREP